VSYIDKKWYVYGVTSYVMVAKDAFGRSKCLAEKPSYFTRVNRYKNWITEKIKN